MEQVTSGKKRSVYEDATQATTRWGGRVSAEQPHQGVSASQ